MEALSTKKKNKRPKMHSQIRSALRKLFMWSETRHKVFKQSGKICSVCKGEFLRKDLQVDHIQPVGPTPGTKNAGPDTTWDVFINRMFCDESGLRVVCVGCHNKKTHNKNA